MKIKYIKKWFWFQAFNVFQFDSQMNQDTKCNKKETPKGSREHRAQSLYSRESLTNFPLAQIARCKFTFLSIRSRYENSLKRQFVQECVLFELNR